MNSSIGKKVTNLDHPLISFSNHPDDTWTVRDAVRGVQIFGGIGSGKTSGSGRALAMAFLRSGFGGIILTGKVDETKLWIEYAKKTGRSKDLLVFSENSKYRFNPLEYELTREGEGAGQTENIVALFTSLAKMGNRLSGSGGGSGDDPFWDMALQRCIKAAVDLLKLSKQDITVANMARLIREAPTGENYLYQYYELSRLANEGNEEAYQELNKWAQQSFAVHCMVWAESYELKGQDLKAFEVVSSYFLSDFATLAEKTRSSIAEYFYAFANPFRSGLLAEFFAGGTTKDILPEVTFKGKIIILDFPVKKYLQLGIYAQAIYKRIWQQAVEVRDVKRNPVPVFMWVDEAQYFLNEEDMMFQTTARSSKACTVMLSQNISNYYATIGGKNPKERVNSLLGNLATKIFHANNDYVTNEWAANTIGKTFQSRTSSSVGKYDSVSVSESLNYQVEPQEFTVLLSGSVINDFDVEGVVTVAGKKWSNGKNFIKVAFNQKAI
ncbi:MAG: TraM recognition domain-containing protein [Bacteroidota bacterium]